MDKRREVAETSSSAEEELHVPKLECAICLQKCVHPAKLPCGHIFCYLCVKGIANQSKRCAMCRQEIPADLTEKPELVPESESDQESSTEESYRWFYEGRNGWWQYDERTSAELEAASAKQEPRCEVLIAGFLYIVDFEHMVQVRRNDFSRRRRVKRDLASVPKKGIAGIRLEEPAQDPSSNTAPRTRDRNSSGRTPGHASQSNLESSNVGGGGNQTSPHSVGESTVEVADVHPNTSGGAGDASVLLAEDEISTPAFLEGASFHALRLDSEERGSGDASSSSSAESNHWGQHGCRRYYEDNL